MTKQDKTYSGMIGDVARLTAALAANAAELPHLEGVRGRLEKILADTQEMAKQQATLVASKQDASKKLRSLVTEGKRVATGVTKLLKQQYGLSSEKLAEFGVQPFRGRKAKASNPDQPGTPTPSPGTPTPPPAAHPTNPNQ